ncbi:hypothetical protein J7T55_009894 [Diaporthe amygdali]|uniref:uncharacterized protein n=1 Tax=Phomopsis amygdali TaxID=1214568 RepID=UPI0022FED708|nr:uncharacterized protein J7T55_009894 [Diaporthe amygdali]KAJ0116744.1 hypothetical protein J7T55_009894 [Diaporthe amygdali]
MEVSEKSDFVGSPAAPGSLVIDSTSDFSADQRDMQRMGKKQEFKRNFNWFSSIAFTSCTMGTWEFVFINNFQSLVDGGRAGMFWSYCWVIFGQFFVVLSLAEMSSMAPTAGGQYHWVSEFSPQSIQKISSYASGWLSALCWQSFVASDCIFTAQLLMAAVSIGNPGFSPELWQTSLLAMLIGVMVTSLNIWCSKRLPVIENFFVFLHIACFVIVMVILGVTSQKTPAKQVFLEVTDNGGNYPTLGLAVMVGQVSAMWNVCASDAVAHISEEVKDASIIAPRAMFWSFALNAPIAFAIMLMFLFTVPDVTAATTEYTFPFLSILASSSLPPAGAQAITSLMVVLVFMISVSTFASTSRQCFAFARDQGFPASDWLRRVDPALNVPRNSCIFTFGFTIVMCLVYLGSSVAFNAILSIGIVALMGTYGLSTGCVLYRRLRWPETLPPVRWSLGRWGILVNGIDKVPSSVWRARTGQVQLTSIHHGTTRAKQTVHIMSQYNTGPQSTANDAGWASFDPKLAPFLPTMDQSGGWTSPAHAGTGQSTGSTAPLPPIPEPASLHAKAGFTGHKAYLCTCGKAFTRASALRRHIEESTTQARKHNCPLCDHEFKRSGHVEQHLRLVHKKPNDVIKDLLTAQASKPLEEVNLATTSSAAVPATGSMNAHAGYPVLLSGGPWTEPTGFHSTVLVDGPVSQPGYFSDLLSGFPVPGTGFAAKTPALMSHDFVAQATGCHVYPAGAVPASQTGFTGDFAPDLASNSAAQPEDDLGLFDPNLASVMASVTVDTADGFGMPALESDSIEGIYDVDLDIFGL